MCDGRVVLGLLSTDAVVATGAEGAAAVGAVELGLVAPAVELSEGAAGAGSGAALDAVSELVIPEVSGAFALVLLMRGT